MAEPYATRALEYLVLNPDQKINYRAKGGISLKSWYGSFQPEMSHSELVPIDQICSLIGVCRKGFSDINQREGLLPMIKIKGKLYAKLSPVYALQERIAKLIPFNEFFSALRANGYIASRKYLKETYSHFLVKGLKKSLWYFSIVNASKILHDLKLRNQRDKKWPTLQDIHDAVGSSNSLEYSLTRYHNFIRSGKLGAVLVPGFGEGNHPIVEYRIPPDEFRRFVEAEKDALRLAHDGMTIEKLAHKLGQPTKTLYLRIKAARGLGIVNPFKSPHPLGHMGTRRLFIPSGEACRILSGEIALPSTYAFNTLRVRNQVLSPIISEIRISHLPRNLEEEVLNGWMHGEGDALLAMRKMYGNFFEALQRKRPYGVSLEEWDNFILTALYETLAECGVNISRRALFRITAQNLKTRVAEEKSSFLRLGITPSGEDASDSRIDFDSDKGILVLRKNPGNF